MPRLSEESNERKLNKIASQMMIDIPVDGHYVQSTGADKSICFKVIFNAAYPVTLKITKIHYQLFNDEKLLHKGIWKGVITLDEANLRGNIFLVYRPSKSQFDRLSLEKDWAIAGTVKVESVCGSFEKNFESTDLRVFSIYPSEKVQQKCN